jgi:hypothetical protein
MKASTDYAQHLELVNRRLRERIKTLRAGLEMIKHDLDDALEGEMDIVTGEFIRAALDRIDISLEEIPETYLMYGGDKAP